MAEESEIEMLTRLLNESRLEREQLDLEREQLDLESEQLRLESEQLRLESKQLRLETKQLRLETEQLLLRKEKLRQEIRETTLSEYIEACHNNVFLKIRVQLNRPLAPIGSTTYPQGKSCMCPTNVMPWKGFLAEQICHLRELFGSFPLNDRLFCSKHGLSGFGGMVSREPIANERMLERFMLFAIEDPVQCIVKQLVLKNVLADQYRIGEGIIFENYLSDISDVSLGDDNGVPARLWPYEICVYRNINEAASMKERNLLFIGEYKAPHKLTAEHLRVGLQQKMDILKDFVNNPKVPTNQDPQVRFEYYAKRLTAAAITKIYHYMIEDGVSYGILTNGVATVFLKVDWASPETLLYHLAESEHEVPVQPEPTSCTAVSQYLSFILLALSQRDQERIRSQEKRQSVRNGVKKWVYDFEDILRNMSVDGKTPRASSGSSYKPETHEDVDRSPLLFRRNRREEADYPAKESASRRSPTNSDDEAEENAPGSPSPAARRTRSRERQNTSQSRGAASSRNSTRGEQYCTQKCLIGLVNGDFLDTRCPNVSRHIGDGPAPSDMKAKTYHPVNHATWLQLLREQWKKVSG